MEEEMKKKPMEEAKIGFDLLNEDIVEKILKRLPALSLASAACVCKSWSQHSNRILSCPKLASALSLNSSPDIAVQEVLDKVLSEPIRPHFAIASSFGDDSGFQKTYNFLARKLGSRTPLIVTSWHAGIMGRDAISNEFKEVLGGDDANDANSGILLTVGFLPGLKVEAIPMLRPLTKPFQGSIIDALVMDIRTYTASASACTSPIGIIMFGSRSIDLKPVMEKLDYAMSKDTVIVGDEKAECLYRSGIESRTFSGSASYTSDAIALVFAKDRCKPDGIGEIQFHAMLSSGVSAIGPRYKAVSVKENNHDCIMSTWLTARQEGQHEILDGEGILSVINNELENRNGGDHLYIGVTKQRKCSIGTEKLRLMRSLAFHALMGADEEYLYVYGSGIRTADYFQFYYPDPSTALSSSNDISTKLRNLKLEWCSEKCHHPSDDANEFKKECIGGFIFSCCGRGESFFDRPNVDSSPFLENFPGVPLAGIFCGGENGRGFTILNAHENQEESNLNCSLHVYSSVYLILTYNRLPLEH